MQRGSGQPLMLASEMCRGVHWNSIMKEVYRCWMTMRTNGLADISLIGPSFFIGVVIIA